MPEQLPQHHEFGLLQKMKHVSRHPYFIKNNEVDTGHRGMLEEALLNHLNGELD